jgi:hypothetical protein
MTPFNIVAKALEKGLSVIGITDHNSTLQCEEVVRIASREGLFVLCGAEITTKEEVHVLAFVEGSDNLISALDQTIEEVEQFINSLNGIFIPAHIDKKQNSVMSQLGFMPPGLRADALELSPGTDDHAFRTKNKYLSSFNLIHSSDAHYPEDIGRVFTDLPITDLSFDTVRSALKNN